MRKELLLYTALRHKFTKLRHVANTRFYAKTPRPSICTLMEPKDMLPLTVSPRAWRVLVKVPCWVVVVILSESPVRAMQFLTPAGMSCWLETVLVWPLTVMDPEKVRVLTGVHIVVAVSNC